MDVTFKAPTDLHSRVLLLESVTQAICEEVGESPGDGVRYLLMAAIDIAKRSANPPVTIDELKGFVITMLESLKESHVRH